MQRKKHDEGERETAGKGSRDEMTANRGIHFCTALHCTALHCTFIVWPIALFNAASTFYCYPLPRNKLPCHILHYTTICCDLRQ